MTPDFEGNAEHSAELTELVEELTATARARSALAQISFDSPIWPAAWNQSNSHCHPLAKCKMAAPSPGYDYPGDHKTPPPPPPPPPPPRYTMCCTCPETDAESSLSSIGQSSNIHPSHTTRWPTQGWPSTWCSEL